MAWTFENERHHSDHSPNSPMGGGTVPDAYQNLAILRHDLTAALEDGGGAATTTMAVRGYVVGIAIDFTGAAPPATWDLTLTDQTNTDILTEAHWTQDWANGPTADFRESIGGTPIPVFGPLTLTAANMGTGHGGSSVYLYVQKVP